MTNDIEGKVRILKEILKQFSNEPLNTPYIDALKTAILSLTTKPLDEKEVFKLIDDNITDDVHEDYQGNMLEEKKALAKLICSHFSKPVIKYPEKYELFEDDRNVDMSLGEAKMGMNKLIDEMRRLNGEGGV